MSFAKGKLHKQEIGKMNTTWGRATDQKGLSEESAAGGKTAS